MRVPSHGEEDVTKKEFVGSSPLSPAPTIHWRPGAYVDRVTVVCPEVGRWVRALVPFEGYADTHGDPTLENLMYRPSTGEPVLIDPLPDAVLDDKVPSVRALDLGKVLQSGIGYEGVKTGRFSGWMINPVIFDAVQARCRDQREWAQSRALCALHVCRFIPYQTDDLRERWISWLPGILDALRLT